MQDTILNWLMIYLITTIGMFYIVDDIHWLVRLVLSLFWPLALITTVVILIVSLIKN